MFPGQFFAVLFLSAVNTVLIVCFCIVHIFVVVFGSWFIIPISLLLIGRMRGLLPFDGVTVIVFCSLFMSVHLSFVSSSVLMPVSFRICMLTACLWVCADAMSWSISCSVGMNGNLCSVLYLGLSHVLPMNFRYLVQ